MPLREEQPARGKERGGRRSIPWRVIEEADITGIQHDADHHTMLLTSRPGPNGSGVADAIWRGSILRHLEEETVDFRGISLLCEGFEDGIVEVGIPEDTSPPHLRQPMRKSSSPLAISLDPTVHTQK